MKTIYVDNNILSSDDVARAIELKNIKMTCNDCMQIEISDADLKKLATIIDPADICIED